MLLVSNLRYLRYKRWTLGAYYGNRVEVCEKASFGVSCNMLVHLSTGGLPEDGKNGVLHSSSGMRRVSLHKGVLTLKVRLWHWWNTNKVVAKTGFSSRKTKTIGVGENWSRL